MNGKTNAPVGRPAQATDILAGRPSCHVQHTPGGARCQAGKYRNARGQVVAELVGDTLRKSAHGSRHMLRTPPAWAFDVAILQDAERVGAVFAEVYDVDTRETYRARLVTFWERGFPVDRGFGKQQALPLSAWRVTRPGTPVQLELFGNA